MYFDFCPEFDPSLHKVSMGDKSVVVENMEVEETADNGQNENNQTIPSEKVRSCILQIG